MKKAIAIIIWDFITKERKYWVDPAYIWISGYDINRMNGQLANHIKIFKDVNKKTENPDASLIHYSDCKTAEQKF